jgi:hypothetical protein
MNIADKEADRILEAVEEEEIDGYQFALMAVKYFGTPAIKAMLRANLVDLAQPEEDMESAFPEIDGGAGRPQPRMIRDGDW